MVELIQSCPISCNIDCEDLASFEITLSFGINSVANFLAPTSVATMEQISAEYLTNYIQGRAEGSRFFLYRVELLSQKLASRRGLRAEGRTLQSKISLVATVAYRGYVIGLKSELLEEYLLQGTLTKGYTKALQRSGDQSLNDVEISLLIDPDATRGPVGSVEEDDGKGAVTASIVVSFLAVGALTASLLLAMRKRRLQRAMKDHGSDIASAGASVRSPLAQILSFDSIVRIVSGGQSNDTPTDGDTTSHSEEENRQRNKERKQSDDDINPSSSSESDETEEEHPLTGIIPPMIVLDIEENGKKDKPLKGKTRNVVPSRRSEVSVDLLAKMTGGVCKLEHFLSNFARTESKKPDISESEQILPVKNDQHNNDEDLASSPTMTTSNVNDEGDAFAPRASSTSPTPSPPLIPPRNSLSDDEELKKISDNGLPPSIPRRQLFSGRLRKSSFTGSEGQNTSRRSIDLILPGRQRRRSSFGSDGSRSKSLSDASRQNLSDGDITTTSNPESGSLLFALFGSSPTKKLRKAYSSPTDSISSSAKATPVPPKVSDHCRTSSKGSEASSNGFNGTKLNFQVPRRGKLGLTIECDLDGIPIVRHVKDYSPLLGKVFTGDRVVSIDGVMTLQPTLSEVENLLEGKSRWTPSSTMKIVFWRPAPDEEDDSLLFSVDDDSTSDIFDNIRDDNFAGPVLEETYRSSSSGTTSTSNNRPTEIETPVVVTGYAAGAGSTIMSNHLQRHQQE